MTYPSPTLGRLTTTAAIETRIFATEYEAPADDLMFMHRKILPGHPIQCLDPLPEGIGFLSGHLTELRLTTPGGIITLRGSFAAYVPGNIIIPWHAPRGGGEFSAMFSTQTFDRPLPTQPLLLTLSHRTPFPSNLEDLMRILHDEPSIPLPLGLPHGVSSVARRLKSILDSSYCGEAQISQIASDLRVPRETLTRSFHQAYGMTPLAYRTRLRLMACIPRLVRRGGTVSEIAMDCGFGSTRQFNDQFRREFGCPPSTFWGRSMQTVDRHPPQH